MSVPNDLRTAASHAGIKPDESFSIRSMRAALGAEHGQVQVKFEPYPLRLLTYNTALITTAYGGHDADKAAAGFINELRKQPADIVGLCELFKAPFRPGFSDAFIRNLKDIYPHYVKGPSGTEMSDSGLLLFSKFPILESHKMEYIDVAGVIRESFDDLASKGAIHARIDVPQIGPTDIFLTHCQATDSDTSHEWDELRGQLTDLGYFWRAYADPQLPSFAMGDFNVPADHPTYADHMLPALDAPTDLWPVNHPDEVGLTFADGNTFSGSPRTGAREGRLDYFLMKPGPYQVPVVSDLDILQWKDSDGKDVSDHYGLLARFDQALQFHSQFLWGFQDIKVELKGFYPFQVHPDLRETMGDFIFNLKIHNDFLTLYETELDHTYNGLDYHSFSVPEAKSHFSQDPGNFLFIEVDGIFHVEQIPTPAHFRLGQLKIPRQALLQGNGHPVKHTLALEADRYDLTFAMEFEITVSIDP